MRISAALATAALLTSAMAGTAAANVGTITVTGGPTPNPVTVGGTASYNLTVENNGILGVLDTWFAVTGVADANGTVSLVSSPCVKIRGWRFFQGYGTGSLNGVIVRTSSSTPVGTETITLTVTDFLVSGCAGPGFDTNTQTATLVVKAAQTITFGALANQVYGVAPFTVSATASSGLPVTFSAAVGGPCSVSGSTVTITGIGPCSITARQAGDATYAPAADVTRTFTIAPGVLTVTPNHKEKTYGQVNPTLTVSITGFAYGEPHSVATGNASITTTATTASPAGDYPITASPYSLSAANYTFSYGSGTLTVHPAPAVVKADSLTKVQGDDNPAFTWTIDGFVNGDTAAVLTLQPTCAANANTSSPIGVYPIKCTGATDANYTFSYDDGNLTVVGGSLHHIVISPDPATIAAGATQAYTAEGFDVNNNSLGNVTASTVFTISGGSCTGAVCSSTVAGTHTVTGTDGTLTDTATLIVSAGAPNLVVISPDPKTIVAGSTQAYTVEVFDANGNSLGDATALTVFTISGSGSCTGAVCGSGVVGDYAVTATTDFPDIGRRTDTAILHVTAATPTVAPTEVVGGETATPSRNATLPPTSTNGSGSSDGSLPLLVLLIALAFSALGLLAVQVQRREVRR